MAAAAALSRSRGMVGVRSTKGLFFIFTLMGLVCLASSLIRKDQLDDFKRNVQQAKEQLDSLKTKYKSGMAISSDLISDHMSLLDRVIALTTEESSELPDDFPSINGFLQSIKDFMKTVKTYVESHNVQLGERIEDSEQKLRKIQNLIKVLEEQYAEL